MHSTKPPRFSKSLIFGSLTLIAVFIIDLLTPLGIAVGALYAVCFFLVCREKRKVIIAFAVTTASLTVIKLLLFASADTSYMAYVNRAISVSAIAVLCLVSLRHRRLWEELDSQRNSHIKQLEEMLYVTSHKVRRPISTCLGLMQLIDNSKPLDQAELHKIIEHLKENALELDTFTKELTKFIYEIQQRNKTTGAMTVESVTQA